LSNSGTESNNTKYENQISEIIQGELIDLYGRNGYKSIIETMMKICGKTEKEIITNYELFAELTEGVFGRLGNSKILDPIKFKIDKIGIDNIHQDEKPVLKKPMRILVADDEPSILKLYSVWLKLENRHVITVEDGQKCLEVYKKEYNHHQLENYFDVVILDEKMPKMTGLQVAVEILKINPQQRIIFASGYLEKTLLESLTTLNKAIEVLEKPFLLEALDNMINKTTILEKLEKINIRQEEEKISERLADAMEVLKTQNY
jgi:two-component system cell cycle response regulator CpdR